MASLGFAKVFNLQGRLPLVSCTRTMMSLKNPAYIPEEKPKPYDYKNYDYKFPWLLFDKTTSKFQTNSRLIVLEGAHAVGKTALGKRLAEEFGMLHMDYPRVESNYINHYGEDLRKYKEYLNPFNQPFTEKEFYQNPMGHVDGCCDRYMFALYMKKLDHYLDALEHLFSTGQGVILEGSVLQHYAHMEAAYNQGWIDRNTVQFLREGFKCVEPFLLRPHVIIYLDAPIEVVQKNIKDRGNEWDKDSPVWNNKQYLRDIYNEVKRKYLKHQQHHLYVMMYDWSEPGDEELIVEDLEALEMEHFDQYSDMQKDWKASRSEQLLMRWRLQYCNARNVAMLRNKFLIPKKERYNAEHLWVSPQDRIDYQNVFSRVNSMMYDAGFNPLMGDKTFWSLSARKHKDLKTKDCAPYSMKGIYNAGILGWEKGLS